MGEASRQINFYKTIKNNQLTNLANNLATYIIYQTICIKQN